MSSLQIVATFVGVLAVLLASLSFVMIALFKRLEKKIQFLESSLLFTMAALAPVVKRVGKKYASSKND